MKRIGQNDKAEFLGQIIDIFEDFLEERGIDSRSEYNSISKGGTADPDNAAIIYGTDYGCLAEELEVMMVSWDLMCN